MPRVARVVVAGLPHHVTQRGNNRQQVFFADDDHHTYLQLLGEEARRYALDVLGYCLMPNHTHLVVVPRDRQSLAKAIGRAHWRYTQAINQRHGRSGHLWQNRFYSAALDNAHALYALRYVDCNPVRAGLCSAAVSYPWSSAAAHASGRDPGGLLDLPGFRRRFQGRPDGGDWARALAAPLHEAQVMALRRATHTGRPLAAERALAKLEASLGCRLRPLKVGRPRKDAGADKRMAQAAPQK
jgi:putative transposase